MTKGKIHIFYGWWIVLASFILIACGGGAYNSISRLLLGPIRAEFGWLTSTMAGAAFSVSSAVSLIGGLIAGPFIDRIGPRKLMLIGIPLLGTGFILLNFATALWMFYLFSGLIGLEFGLSLFIAPHTAIANWFLKRRSIALALLLMGSALGKEIAKLTMEGFTDQYKWQIVVLILGILILVIGIPLVLFVRHKPEQYGYLPNGEQVKANQAEDATVKKEADYLGVDFTLREALKTRAFWLLAIAVIIGTTAVTAIRIHEVPFLINKEFIDHWTLTHILRFLPLMSIPGILIFGYLGDIFTKRYLLAIAIGIKGISAIILMTSVSVWQIYLYMLVYGFGSGLIPLMFAIRADYFGRKAFATIAVVMLVIIALLGGLISFLPASLYGWLLDITETPQLIFVLSMVVCFVAAAVFFFAKPPGPPKRVMAEESRKGC